MTMQIRLKFATAAAILVAAVIVYFATRTPWAESPPMAAVETLAAVVERVNAADVSPSRLPAWPDSILQGPGDRDTD